MQRPWRVDRAAVIASLRSRLAKQLAMQREDLEHLRTHGYVILRNFLSPDVLDAARRACHRLTDEVVCSKLIEKGLITDKETYQDAPLANRMIKVWHSNTHDMLTRTSEATQQREQLALLHVRHQTSVTHHHIYDNHCKAFFYTPQNDRSKAHNTRAPVASA